MKEQRGGNIRSVLMRVLGLSEMTAIMVVGRKKVSQRVKISVNKRKLPGYL